MDATTVLGAEHFDRELVAAITTATDAAAAAARDWLGRGDKIAADAAAVEAMRVALAEAPFDGTVVIGEGEKDAAPMLHDGERLGTGAEPVCDVAVDPLDGTRLVAEGLPGAISVIALAPRGTMFDPAGVFYMDKLVAGPAGVGVLDLEAPIERNLTALAAATGRPVERLTAGVLDKPRHVELVARIRSAGARVLLVGEGDVSIAIQAAVPESGVDLVAGIGGTPEGVVTACAVRALGGFLEGRLAPRTEGERTAARAAGRDLSRVLSAADLVTSDRVLVVAAPVR